jgi:hypothetical protein
MQQWTVGGRRKWADNLRVWPEKSTKILLPSQYSTLILTESGLCAGVLATKTNNLNIQAECPQKPTGKRQREPIFEQGRKPKTRDQRGKAGPGVSPTTFFS